MILIKVKRLLVLLVCLALVAPVSGAPGRVWSAYSFQNKLAQRVIEMRSRSSVLHGLAMRILAEPSETDRRLGRLAAHMSEGEFMSARTPESQASLIFKAAFAATRQAEEQFQALKPRLEGATIDSKAKAALQDLFNNRSFLKNSEKAVVEAWTAAQLKQAPFELNQTSVDGVAQGELIAHHAGRRQALMKALPNKLILISGERTKLRSAGSDVELDFRQRSGMDYLSGFDEAGAHLLLDARSGKTTLFLPRLTRHHKIFSGPGPSADDIRRDFGIEDTRRYSDLAEVLDEVAGRRSQILIERPANQQTWRAVHMAGLKAATEPLHKALAALRLVKTPFEMELIARAYEISSLAHVAAMRAVRPGMSEKQLEGVFQNVLHQHGLTFLAYPSIVASGRNGSILHYAKNSGPIRSGDNVVMDAAGELRRYASDITSTFPADRKFTSQQRELVSVAWEAQLAVMRESRLGVTREHLQLVSELSVAAGLVSMGLLIGDPAELVASRAVAMFYPHKFGHGIGMNVHDPLGYKAPLRANMPFTIEPGIYPAGYKLSAPELRKKFRDQINWDLVARFRDVGAVRLEKGVVLLDDGRLYNMTRVPHDPDGIEAVRQAD